MFTRLMSVFLSVLLLSSLATTANASICSVNLSRYGTGSGGIMPLPDSPYVDYLKRIKDLEYLSTALFLNQTPAELIPGVDNTDINSVRHELVANKKEAVLRCIPGVDDESIISGRIPEIKNMLKTHNKRVKDLLKYLYAIETGKNPSPPSFCLGKNFKNNPTKIRKELYEQLAFYAELRDAITFWNDMAKCSFTPIGILEISDSDL